MHEGVLRWAVKGNDSPARPQGLQCGHSPSGSAAAYDGRHPLRHWLRASRDRHDDPHPPAFPRRPRRQLPAPEAPARRARRRSERRDHAPRQLRAVEDDAIAEIVKFQEDVGLRERHRRRVPAHLLPHRLPRAARRRQDRHPGHDQEARRHRRARPAGDARDRQGAPRQGHPARRFRVPEVAGDRRPHAQGDDPVADHAALPRRPRRHQPRAYPDLEPFYDDVARAYRDELRSLAAAGCTYVQMDDTNLAYLCDDKMREAARSRGDDPDELPHRYAALHQPRRRAEARRA